MFTDIVAKKKEVLSDTTLNFLVNVIDTKETYVYINLNPPPNNDLKKKQSQENNSLGSKINSMALILIPNLRIKSRHKFKYTREAIL